MSGASTRSGKKPFKPPSFNVPLKVDSPNYSAARQDLTGKASDAAKNVTKKESVKPTFKNDRKRPSTLNENTSNTNQEDSNPSAGKKRMKTREKPAPKSKKTEDPTLKPSKKFSKLPNASKKISNTASKKADATLQLSEDKENNQDLLEKELFHEINPSTTNPASVPKIIQTPAQNKFYSPVNSPISFWSKSPLKKSEPSSSSTPRNKLSNSVPWGFHVTPQGQSAKEKLQHFSKRSTSESNLSKRIEPKTPKSGNTEATDSPPAASEHHSFDGNTFYNSDNSFDSVTVLNSKGSVLRTPKSNNSNPGSFDSNSYFNSNKSSLSMPKNKLQNSPDLSELLNAVPWGIHVTPQRDTVMEEYKKKLAVLAKSPLNDQNDESIIELSLESDNKNFEKTVEKEIENIEKQIALVEMLESQKNNLKETHQNVEGSGKSNVKNSTKTKKNLSSKSVKHSELSPKPSCSKTVEKKSAPIKKPAKKSEPKAENKTNKKTATTNEKKAAKKILDVNASAQAKNSISLKTNHSLKKSEFEESDNKIVLAEKLVKKPESSKLSKKVINEKAICKKPSNAIKIPEVEIVRMATSIALKKGKIPKFVKYQKLTQKERIRVLHNLRDVGTWVQCSSAYCSKWRYLAQVKDPADVPSLWYCNMNPDLKYNSCKKPEQNLNKKEFEDEILTSYTAGSIVWAKLPGYVFWPAMVEDDPELETFYWLKDCDSKEITWYHVTFFDSKPVTRAWIPVKSVLPFTGFESRKELNQVTARGINYTNRISAAKKLAMEALDMQNSERLAKYSFINRYKGPIVKRKLKNDSSSEEEESFAESDSNEPADFTDKEDAAPEESSDSSEDENIYSGSSSGDVLRAKSCASSEIYTIGDTTGEKNVLSDSSFHSKTLHLDHEYQDNDCEFLDSQTSPDNVRNKNVKSQEYLDSEGRLISSQSERLMDSVTTGIKKLSQSLFGV